MAERTYTDEMTVKEKMRQAMSVFGGSKLQPVHVDRSQLQSKVTETLVELQPTVLRITEQSKDRVKTTPLPNEVTIGGQAGRGSSHKIMYEVTSDDGLVFLTVPADDSSEVGKLALEFDVYGRLASKGVGCPKVEGLYSYQDRIGYLATKLTGSETKYMQLGFYRTKLLKAWKEDSENDIEQYKTRLRNLRDGMQGIVDCGLVFEDFQCFIGDDGMVSVFDPTGVAEVLNKGGTTNFGTGEARATARIANDLLTRLD